MPGGAELLTAYDAQLRAHVSDRLAPGVLVERDGPLVRLLGLPGRGFVLYRDLGGLEEAELDELIARQVQVFADRGERFEPRLARPRVRLLDAQQVRAPQMRFVVEAVLVMDPGREDVMFDTVLEIASGEYDVRDSDASASG